jgi:hypothetical protein
MGRNARRRHLQALNPPGGSRGNEANELTDLGTLDQQTARH